MKKKRKVDTDVYSMLYFIQSGGNEKICTYLLFSLLRFAKIWKILKDGGGGERGRNGSKTSPEDIVLSRLAFLNYAMTLKE